MIPYQLTSTAIGAGIALIILYLVRRDHLHGLYAIWWLLVAAGVMVLGFYPVLIDRLAQLLGVGYPPVLALVLGLGLILIKMLTMDLHRSRQERKIRRLTQRLALLEQELDSATGTVRERMDNSPENVREQESRPGAARPDAARPDAARPDAARPDAARPDAARSSAARSGATVD